MSRTSTLPLGIASVGGLLPEETLLRIASGNGDLPGAKPAAYHLAKDETVTDVAERSWTYLRGRYAAFKDQLADGDPAVGVTREYWLGRLFQELGFGHLPRVPAGGLASDDGEKQFAISHHWQHVPIHQLGWGVGLDRRTKGIVGAADAAPQSLVQEYLNRSAAALWGVVTNGRLLRVLRDSSALAGSAYVEFDLEAIFEGEAFDAFVLLYRVAHSSRFEHQGEDNGPASCWLEKWRQEAIDSGARILKQLRVTVKEAIETLGSGFIRHPDNQALRDSLEDDDNKAVTPETLHRALLRTVYRLLFLFVAEDRDVLLSPDAPQTARDRYDTYFSTDRLRRMAARRHGGRHADEWQAVTLILDGLNQEGGRCELGLPALGGIFELSDADHALHGLSLTNEHLFNAVRSLSRVHDQKTRRIRRVDFKHLGSEELGSVYESLLEYVPKHDPDKGVFELRQLSGNDRKTSGSYYTPSSLIDTLLDSALEPVIDDAVKSGDTPEEQEAALLALTVCDPACGSGHFLVAAARRIAKRLAFVRTGDPEPSNEAIRHALRDVVSRCIYGVDINPMAVELAKVSLWLEALEPGKALTFLDAHIKVGNALFGTTPKLLDAGLPDDAFKAIEGDDQKWVTALKKRNKGEREAYKKRHLGVQGELFDETGLRVGNYGLARRAAAITDAKSDDLIHVHAQQNAYQKLQEASEYLEQKELHDAWCAAFVWTKTEDHAPAITTRDLIKLSQDADTLASRSRAELQELVKQYRFFHWHLEFPTVFTVPKDENAPGTDPQTGWIGGFNCVLGNPPWDTLSPDAKEFFAQYEPEVRSMKKAEQRIVFENLLSDPKIERDWSKNRREIYASVHFFKNSGRYRLFAPGNLGKGDFNVYRMFVELALRSTRPSGSSAQITPGGLYSGANAQAIRLELFTNWTIQWILGFINRTGDWFPGVHSDTTFAAYVAFKYGHTSEFTVGFQIENYLSMKAALADPQTITLESIRSMSPQVLAINEISSGSDADLTQVLYKAWPAFGEEVPGYPHRRYQAEIHMGNDRDLFTEDDRGIPVYEGRMVSQYDYRAKAYISGRGRSAVWKELKFGHREKKIAPQWRVLQGNIPEKAQMRVARYRVAFCDVTGPRNERSLLAALVPPGVICGHKTPTFTYQDGCDWAYLPWLAIANSFAIDFLVRKRVSLSVTLGILDELPIPRLRLGDDRLNIIAPLVLRLSCTGPEMTTYWNSMSDHGWCRPVKSGQVSKEVLIDEFERADTMANINAFVAKHLFGLDKDRVAYILSTFPVLRRNEERALGEFRTSHLVMDWFDRW